MTQQEALEAMLRSDSVTVGPQEVGAVLGVHQSYITDDAKLYRLPFPAYLSGNRVKIPRAGFLRWGGWSTEGGEKA